MRVVQFSSGFNHLIIGQLHEQLLKDGVPSLVILPDSGSQFLSTNHAELKRRLGGDAMEMPVLSDSSAQGQQRAARELTDLIVRFGGDVAVYHEPPPGREKFLGALAANILTVGFVHTVICPGGKLLRSSDRVCGYPMGWGCLKRWYTGPCGTAKSPGTAVGAVRSALARRNMLKRLPSVIVTSEFMRTHLTTEGIDGSRISVVDHGYSLDGSESIGDTERSAATNSNRLLYVGRLSYSKGLQNLLVILVDLPDCSLTVVGDGYYRPELESLAHDLGVAGRVRFAGWLDPESVRQQYKRADLLVVPSLIPESLGAVVAEAARYGLNSVVSDRGALPEWRQVLPSVRVADISSPSALVIAIRESLAGRPGVVRSTVDIKLGRTTLAHALSAVGTRD